MLYQCWPRVTDPGLVCECGEFKIGGVSFTIARQRYREHIIEVYEREKYE